MSTLDGPFGGSAALHRFVPPGHVSSAHKARKDEASVEMNVTAHQEKEKNEKTKKGKRGAGQNKKRKQATDFEEAVYCPSGVVQGSA